ncbi:MAG: flippase-like domain-containing protein [Anaerolineae bacterium]|nr:MAG: flippase-like domain-containing protein [Anaerolineae bacterium]
MKSMPRWIAPVLWLASFALLAFGLSQVSFQGIWESVRELSAWELVVLLLLNSGIIVLFGQRWRVILAAQGYRIPVIAITRIRLASFGVSYFTPGPHIGGELVQVIHLTRHHGVPAETATASVTLDKLFEMLANFAFLAAGVSIVSINGVNGATLPWGGMLPVGFLLCMPAIYLLLLWSGKRPLTVLAGRFTRAEGAMRRTTSFITGAEAQMGEFSRNEPGAMAVAFVLSGLVWAALLGEYAFLLRFLGVRVDLVGLVTIITAARLAMLTPLPGALGALETSQTLALQALGFDPAVGLGISLLIRGRDVAFGVAGLLWGGLLRNRL